MYDHIHNSNASLTTGRQSFRNNTPTESSERHLKQTLYIYIPFLLSIFSPQKTLYNMDFDNISIQNFKTSYTIYTGSKF